MTAELSLDTHSASCYHCGERVEKDYGLRINGDYRPLCCPGCRSVAELITHSGLDNFYLQRTAYNDRPDEDLSSERIEFCIYDDPELAGTFSSIDSDGLTRARLLVGGVTCAACTWLIESRLMLIKGVRDAQVSLADSRLEVLLDTQEIRLSMVFQALAALGYSPLPYREDSRAALNRQERRLDLRRLGVAGLGMMQVGMFAIALHAGDIQGMEPRYEQLLRWVSLPVAAWVVFYSARPFFESAWRHLKAGALVMDLPIAIAIGLAFSASLWATLTASGDVYFDSVVMFTFFLLLGRFLEKNARSRVQKASTDAESILPDHAVVLRGDRWQPIPRIQVAVGDHISVRQGELIPLDGSIVLGQSSVKEDTFTGESTPRRVAPGSTVYAGSLNMEGTLEVKSSATFAQSRLYALQSMVNAPVAAKPDLVKFADRVSSVFVAAILIAATATWGLWHFIAPAEAFWISLSVLVISCPCALALATPTALASATSYLRGYGVLTQGENTLESLLRCTHVVFDKTGTLTRGNLQIDKIELLGKHSENEILSLCAGLEEHSTHPAAEAFRQQPEHTLFDSTQQHIAAGVEGMLAGVRFRVGRENFCRELYPSLPPPPDDERMWLALCSEQQAFAWVGLLDEIRSEAKSVVEELQARGLRVEMLTGDNSSQGPKISRALGIQSIKTNQSPQDKLAHVKKLQHKGAIVCMVGDGINDAAVLKRADISFAVAGAMDLSKAQADAVLARGGLEHILTTWASAERCRRVIRQNFCWAIAYNLGAIPVAAAGLIAPWVAAAGMSISSLIVVGNSLRLQINKQHTLSKV